eukprot:5824789-Heterocapsa_arctica.AAC.1
MAHHASVGERLDCIERTTGSSADKHEIELNDGRSSNNDDNGNNVSKASASASTRGDHAAGNGNNVSKASASASTR